ncbi:3-phosphoshikimate 1-carboxyvinyltransferase [Heliobacterium chlorum]|uniref:3-phosphoshikimate 1-carboxyvinyltransferase n=1 Tax=Heliobacterium chlorum TaxID=2698 RepID=A0ABR7SZK6_HELCL|nr:3-phosphoshikimate 1-carboxyvinyltransferase [Heliobacterium chlorum]MBC9783130.1 3-phosphoshikimate 1-carboxyvinyltransferase [Heliobacterium chlorum]
MHESHQIVSITPGGSLRGETEVPGDKSISHRAVMFGALAKGTTRVHRFLPGQDCLSTIDCFRKLGVSIEMPGPTEVLVHGKGLKGLQEPADILDVGNSGTTLRLITGILSGQSFFSVLTGDGSIRRRPMARVTKPLIEMGAAIRGREGANKAPLAIYGTERPLKAIHYQSPVASAQVKSAILLAGLFADGKTRVTEPLLSRDHTERMLSSFGAKLNRLDQGLTTEIESFPSLNGQEIEVPGDISSAAFLLVAASIVPGSELTLRNIGINPTRDGILDVLREMGANLHVENERLVAGEPVADITVQSASLKGTTVGGSIIPRLIDELPIIAVAALFAEGTTIIKDAAELRVKETDRIAVLAEELRKLGVTVEETPDGMIIPGNQQIQGGTVDSHGDHRIAMSLAVAGLLAADETVIHDAASIDVSFPGFAATLQSLRN